MIKVINKIDNSNASFNNMDDAMEHIKIELEWWNIYENKNPYNDNDFIIMIS